jgi:hypothetical protein
MLHYTAGDLSLGNVIVICYLRVRFTTLIQYCINKSHSVIIPVRMISYSTIWPFIVG